MEQEQASPPPDVRCLSEGIVSTAEELSVPRQEKGVSPPSADIHDFLTGESGDFSRQHTRLCVRVTTLSKLVRAEGIATFVNLVKNDADAILEHLEGVEVKLVLATFNSQGRTLILI